MLRDDLCRLERRASAIGLLQIAEACRSRDEKRKARSFHLTESFLGLPRSVNEGRRRARRNRDWRPGFRRGRFDVVGRSGRSVRRVCAILGKRTSPGPTSDRPAAGSPGSPHRPGLEVNGGHHHVGAFQCIEETFHGGLTVEDPKWSSVSTSKRRPSVTVRPWPLVRKLKRRGENRMLSLRRKNDLLAPLIESRVRASPWKPPETEPRAACSSAVGRPSWTT